MRTKPRWPPSPRPSTSSLTNSRTCRRLASIFLPPCGPVRPGVRALSLTQDRLIEKSFLNDLGLRTAPFMAVEDAGALVRAVAALGRPSILKTRRFGYDGKGQALIREGSNLSALHRGLGGAPTILEGFVEFRAGSVGDRRAGPGWRFRRLRHLRKRTRATYPGAHPRSRGDRRRRPRPRRWRSRGRFWRRSTMSACSRSKCSSRARPTAWKAW